MVNKISTKKFKKLISSDTSVIQISLKENKVKVPLIVKCWDDSEIKLFVLRGSNFKGIS